ncbi:MAG TPA: hypothetical protein VJB14_05835 [Planctomycetota bacterium]|nr:hypothetical protein [Planctomycetota bacterium]
MDVVIDGERGKLVPPPTATFERLFKDVRAHVFASRRIVLSMTLDGQDLSWGRQEALKPEVPKAGALLEVRTADSVQFSLETIANLTEHVGNLEQSHEQAAAKMIAGAYKDAMQLLAGCFEGWKVLVSGIRQMANLTAIDLSTLTAGKATVDQVIQETVDSLVRFKEAFDQKDVVRIGDLSQYELKPLLGSWRLVLEVIGRELVRKSPPA